MIDRLVNQLRDRVAIDSGPRRVKDILYDILVPSTSPLQATEDAERYAPRVINKLTKELDDLRRAGHDPWFDFNSSAPDCIQGPCFIEPRDPIELRTAKARRSKSLPMVRLIQGIDWNSFEVLCAKVLALIGAHKAKCTKRSRDQGIDYFGQLDLGHLTGRDFPFVRFQDRLCVWLVGQAKHYPQSKVSSTEIRELVGSIQLARFKEYASATDLYNELPLRSCDPVFALFMTTGEFSRDALALAKDSGVMCKDVYAMAKLLVDNGVGLDVAGEVDSLIFGTWLAS